MDIKKLKTAVIQDIDSRYSEFNELSKKLHDNPEIAFEEKQASAWLEEVLERHDFSMKKGICGLPTAFEGKYGRGKPVIAFLAEYDALPKLGHACGHNLIAASSLAAAIASRKAADELGGTIMVFGTPGEELYGGKAIMAERGAFTDVDMALITHPGGGNTVVMNTLACETLEIEFIGKAAHAAAEAETGINALEAMIQSYNAINSLRQHIREKARINGIITDGGEAANIVPAHTAATFVVRAEDDVYLDELKKKVINCFSGAAKATGAKLKYKWGEHYAAMFNNLTMARLFKQNMQALGHGIRLGDNTMMTFSTDVGNVSQLVPTIQPLVAVAPHGIQLHTPEFAGITATEEALKGLLDAAKSMAMTVVDILGSPDTAENIWEEFRKGK
ncbi:MAG: M20 family metallopeptidase [Dehalococcoidales bacterium]|nr:M20 family metallopeptidase [Dehalococcoidales bacterium]